MVVANGGRKIRISECDNRVAILRDGIKLEINRAGLRGHVYYELYDLNTDPHEFINRYDDESYTTVCNELLALLKNEPYLLETVFREPDGKDYWLNAGSGAGLENNQG